MKKVLTLLALVAFTSVAMATTTTATSKLQTKIDSKLSVLNKKEQDVNSKVEAQKKADAQRKA